MHVFVRGTEGSIDDWKRKHRMVSSVKQGTWSNFLLEKKYDEYSVLLLVSEIALLIIINVRRYMYDIQCMYYFQLLVSRVTNIMLIAYFNDMTRSNKNRNVHVLNVGLKIENLGC